MTSHIPEWHHHWISTTFSGPVTPKSQIWHLNHTLDQNQNPQSWSDLNVTWTLPDPTWTDPIQNTIDLNRPGQTWTDPNRPEQTKTDPNGSVSVDTVSFGIINMNILIIILNIILIWIILHICAQTYEKMEAGRSPMLHSLQSFNQICLEQNKCRRSKYPSMFCCLPLKVEINLMESCR